jgi:hypothetical protein
MDISPYPHGPFEPVLCPICGQGKDQDVRIDKVISRPVKQENEIYEDEL